jgi:hypothetical protein
MRRRSGLAHHAHPVPHLMNSRPARSVVVTWTWFRSQCTWQVSLQRLMRRHLLPSTGSLGLVPPLPRYYEVLRLPAAHFAALRCLRLAIPSLRPLFVQGLRITIAKLGYMGSFVSRTNSNFCRTVLRLSDSVVSNTAHCYLRTII